MADKIVALAMALLNARGAGLDQAQKLIGAPLTRDAALSNEYTDIFVGGTSTRAEIGEVEVRFNKQKNAIRMYILKLKPDAHCLTSPALRKEAGEPRDLSVPSPRYGDNVPTYYEYKHKAGDIRFGFHRRTDPCCSTLVVEYNL